MKIKIFNNDISFYCSIHLAYLRCIIDNSIEKEKKNTHTHGDLAFL